MKPCENSIKLPSDKIYQASKEERVELSKALAQLGKTFTEMQRWLAIDRDGQSDADPKSGSP